MNIDQVGFLPLDFAVGSTTETETSHRGSEFSKWFNTQLAELNHQISESDSQLRMLATGETNNIHQVMLSLEKAKTSFELTLQVRNKLLEGYHDIMRMQI